MRAQLLRPLLIAFGFYEVPQLAIGQGPAAACIGVAGIDLDGPREGRDGPLVFAPLVVVDASAEPGMWIMVVDSVVPQTAGVFALLISEYRVSNYRADLGTIPAEKRPA